MDAQLARFAHRGDDGFRNDAKKVSGLTQTAVATTAGMTVSNLSSAKRSEKTHLTNAKLQQLDKAMVALAPELGGMESLGSLASLGARLRGGGDTDVMFATIPPSWIPQLLDESMTTELGVLIQASTLLSMFQTVKNENVNRGVQHICRQYEKQLKAIVEGLILIGAQPPTARNVDALLLLGALARFAFDQMSEPLTFQVKNSPFGFRVWRAITKLVRLSHATESYTTSHLQPWVGKLLGNAQKLRESSLYPGRSLDLELAIVTPTDWWKDERAHPVTRLLLGRALNSNATVRERGTAAHGIWQRAVAAGKQSDVRADMESILSKLRSDQNERDDVVHGLQWVIATLDHVMANDIAVCNKLPEFDTGWYHAVKDAVSSLATEGIPDNVLPATQKLFEHTILQNAGVERRQAIDTLIVGGYTRAVSHALERLLENEQVESWLRIRAIFALGFLQHRDSDVEDALVAACEHSFSNLRSKQAEHPTPAEATEMHAALFAVGDCYGATGVNPEATAAIRRRLATLLRDVVAHLLEHRDREDQRPVARATAYILTFTAQPSNRATRKDLAEDLLEKLSAYPDDATSDLCDWALKHRFAEDGSIRSLLHAATRGLHSH